jgi:uncharacterized protein (TIGR02246 family)
MIPETRIQGVPASASAIPVGADDWSDDATERGVRAACDRLAQAWSNADVATLASALAEDCDHMTLTRVRQVKRGREALLTSWIEAFARRCPEFSIRMTAAVQKVRMLRDDLTLVDGSLEYSAGTGAHGITQGRSSQPFSAIMARPDGAWIVESLRVGAATAAPKVISFVGPGQQR